MKKNYKITSVNIMQHSDDAQESDDNLYTLMLSTLDVARISEGWTQFALIPGFVFMSGKTVLKKFTF